MFANLTLKARILFSFLVYILFLSLPGFAGSAYFYMNSEKFAQNSENIERGLVADRISNSHVKIQESIFSYVSTKDDKFIDSYNTNYRNLINFIKFFNEAGKTIPRESGKSLQNILTMTQKINELNQSILDLMQAGKTERAIGAIGADETREIGLELAAEIEQLRLAEIKWQTAKAEETQTAMRNLILMVGLATLLFALLAIALSVPIANRILGTANEIISKMLNSSGAIAKDIDEQERNTHAQAKIFSTTLPQVKKLTDFYKDSTDETTLVGRQLGEISEKIVWISHQLKYIKLLTEVRDNLSEYSAQISQIKFENIPDDRLGVSHYFVLIEREIRTLTEQAQTLAQKFNEILVSAETIEPGILIHSPNWSGTGSESPMNHNLVSENLPSRPSQSIDDILTVFEQMTIQLSELALYSHQQATTSEELLQNIEELELATGTTACGMSETNIQMQKLKQFALNLKLFMGDR